MNVEAGEAEDGKIPEWGTENCKGYTDVQFGDKMWMECLHVGPDSEEWIVATKVTKSLDSNSNY